MTAIRTSSRGLVVSLSAIVLAGGVLPAQSQSADEDQQDGRRNPPTTLPFEPTVRSAPPGFSPDTGERVQSRERSPSTTRPQASPPPPPPPGDPLCYEIGPYIRSGVTASRFAGLSAATAQGSPIGSFEAGDALKGAGGETCTVAIPAASDVTIASPYNQVTCPIAMEQSDIAHLDDFEDRRDDFASRLSECPAMSEWTPALAVEEKDSTFTSDQVFSHPDVAVEVIVRAVQHRKSGQWPDNFVRTLSLVLRTPNPDKPPEPETDTEG